ncbi:hypothetical protein [Aurantimonas sp. VKM B-3413]|uniref:phage major tail tube protein n=1 Tax=Aurantimonas sp. VKM B-3413 TaxID=2779401 RepID=UPI001E560370|nr:hypothetical protein [Aurantimonas sp. VKM B-3413]MCB8835926.1 hypothetical protein [Aurantimonas sp. VKM B-3413]
MASKPLLLLQAVDLRRADETGDDSKIIIKSLVFPPVTFVSAEHNPGGGVGAVGFLQPRIEMLEPKFDAGGIDSDIFRGMGLRQKWIFSAAFRNTFTNKALSGRGIIEAAVSGWEPDATDPTEFQGCSHSFAECVHFEFKIDGRGHFYYDFFERTLRTLDGADLWDAGGLRAALG